MALGVEDRRTWRHHQLPKRVIFLSGYSPLYTGGKYPGHPAELLGTLLWLVSWLRPYGRRARKPNVKVTLASKIFPADCGRLNLGHLDPNSIDIDEWKDRENEGILYIPQAGKILYKLKQ